MPDVGQRPRADGLAPRHIPPPGEVFRELHGVPPVDHRQDPLARLEYSLFDSAKPLASVGGEIALRLFAVVHDVDAGVDLLPDALADGAADPRGKGRLVVGLALVPGDQHVAQVVRPRQTAGMCGQDPPGAALHGALPASSHRDRMAVAWAVYT